MTTSSFSLPYYKLLAKLADLECEFREGANFANFLEHIRAIR